MPFNNNAGISHPSKPVHETTDAEWDALFDVNLKGVLHTTRHAFPALVASKGCILNTSSLVGVIGQEIHAAYTATKGGMNTLTKSMALDYAKHGIRVNAVCPAGAWTPMLRQWCAEQPDPNSTERYLDEIHPLGLLSGGRCDCRRMCFFTFGKGALHHRPYHARQRRRGTRLPPRALSL